MSVHFTKMACVFVITTALLAACSNATTMSPIPTSQEATLTIIHGYQGQAQYVAAARANPDSNLDKLYHQHVTDAYWEQCAAGGEYVGDNSGSSSNAIHDLDGLEQLIQLLTTSQLEQQISQTFTQAQQVYPSGDTTVCIVAVDPDKPFVRDKMNGVSGFTFGAGKIWLEIYPEGEWEAWVPYTMAHEYHHSAWTEHHYDKSVRPSLLEYLVFEGRADSFAHALFPSMTAPWSNALTVEEEVAQWQSIEKILKNTSYQTQADYMFGHEKRNIPHWTGYTIGYNIVQHFIVKHPQLSVNEWSDAESFSMFEQSGYDPQR